ncbi:hypothetical protein B0H34DRAFT_675152 [Crassisporium funariophilum]|nr:hypothetical protein B0H34DRAFT_675152 [Crassisporium funariophilum]
MSPKLQVTGISSQVQCPSCGKLFHSCGLANHQKACSQKAAQREQDSKYEAKLNEQELKQAARIAPKKQKPLKPWEKPEIQQQSRSREPAKGLPTLIHTDTPSPKPHNPIASAEEPNRDTIQTEYHPKSGRKPKLSTFEQFWGAKPVDIPPAPDASSEALWTPFKSRADFKFAEIALQAALNQKQVDKLLQIFEQCASGKDKLNLRNNKEIRKIWSDASALISTFTRHELTGGNNQYEMVFDFWCRPLWDWVMDLVFIQFFDEPWTAKRFWEVQNTLPTGAKPIGIILYADKTKLSSFGTQMGYPIVAWFANLPAEIQNGRGIGGGSVVGWPPIIDDDEEEKKKPGYVNFKRVIWHESFRKLLESLKNPSNIGYMVKCGDGVSHHLFPFICILSADYEEQCVMALLQGFRGLCPCPVCLVPNDKQRKITGNYKLRTAVEVQQLLEEVKKCQTEAEKEEMLKEQGLRPIENAFWDIWNSDPFKQYLGIKCILIHMVLEESISGQYLETMEVHTTETIEAGRKELAQFEILMNLFVQATQDLSDKNWDFPKNHTHAHLFDDIIIKILQADVWLGVALILQSLIDASNEKNGLTTVPENVQEKPTDFGNVQLGSPQKSTLIGDPLGQSASSPLFEHFHTKLLKFLSNSGYGTSALNNQITEYQYLKSFYESKVTWKQEVNHLRCSPSFNKQSRYDHVIIQMDSGPIFAQLKFIFTAVVGKERIPFILVQAFDIYCDRHYKKKDKELGFICLRQQSERKAEFFFARSIICGAVIFCL